MGLEPPQRGEVVRPQIGLDFHDAPDVRHAAVAEAHHGARIVVFPRCQAALTEQARMARGSIITSIEC